MAPKYASWLTSATSIFLIWSLLLFAVRTWAKLRPGQQWLLYDNVVLASVLVAFGQVVAVYYSIAHGYTDQYQGAPAEAVVNLDKALYSSQILYVVSIGLSRLSATLFIETLARSKIQNQLALGASGVAGVWTVVCAFLVALRGNISTPWFELEGSHALYMRWLGIEYSGVFLEVILWLLCLSLIWGLNMSMGKRLTILIVFGCRMVLIPIVIIRLHYLDPATGGEMARNSTLVDIITQAAMQYSIMACCITCLKPFLTPFAAGYGYSTGGGYGGSYGVDTYQSADPYSTNATQSSFSDQKPTKPLRSYKRGSQTRGSQSRVTNDSHKLRPENGVFTTSVGTGWGDQIPPRPGSDHDDIELLAHTDNPAIQQTKTFTITEERV